MSFQLNDDKGWLSWEGEDAFLNFSDDFLDTLGWKVGDELNMEVIDENTILVKKKPIKK